MPEHNGTGRYQDKLLTIALAVLALMNAWGLAVVSQIQNDVSQLRDQFFNYVTLHDGGRK